MNGTGYGENTLSPNAAKNEKKEVSNRWLSPRGLATSNRSHDADSSIALTPVQLVLRNEMIEKNALANLKDLNAGFGDTPND